MPQVLYSHMQIHIYIYTQHHNDTINKLTSEAFFREICVPLTLFVMFACERKLETEHNCNILTPTLVAVNVVSFLFSRAAQPETHQPTLLGDGFLYCILSASSLDPNSIGGPEPLRPGVAFPTTFRLSLRLQL